MVDIKPEPGSEEAIRAYKTILSHVIDQRPSGMRQRLADGRWSMTCDRIVL